MHVFQAAGVLAVDDAEGCNGLAVARLERVDDGQIEPAGKRGREEARVEDGTCGQPEAHVGDAEHGAHAEALLAESNGFEDLGDFGLIGGGGHDKAIDCDVLKLQASRKSSVDDTLGDGEALLGRRWDAVFVEREANDSRAIACCNGQHGGEAFSLAVDRVDERTSRIAAAGSFECVRVGGVELQGR